MSDLSFECAGVRSEPHAAGPTLMFRLRVTASGPERVHALALRCQLRIEPALRRYDDAEAERLAGLFGERSRWGRSMRPLQFAQQSLLVPGFSGQTEAELPVPVTYDMDIASARYFDALAGGEAPLTLLFSGTAFRGPGGFRVQPVPWDREARCRLPARVWREAIDQHFPGCGWLRLPRDTMDALLAYRARHGLPSWQDTVAALLSGRPDPPPPPPPPTTPATAAPAPAAPAPAPREPATNRTVTP